MNVSELRGLPLETLYGIRERLISSRDPFAKVGLKVVQAEIRHVQRRIRYKHTPVVILANLPKRDPMVGKQKGACMNNKQIWFGAKNNEVRFAENQSTLTAQGINNPQSFTVNGEVTGLTLDSGEQQVHGGQPSSQTA